METSWPVLTLDQLKSTTKKAIAIGPFGSKLKSSCYVESGVPVIRGTNIVGSRAFDGEFVYVTDEKADELHGCLVYPGDLVFPHRGSIGEVAIVPNGAFGRYLLSSSIMKLTCDPASADPTFLFYFFRSHNGRNEILRFASTVGTPGIGQPLASLRQMRVPAPPIEDQRAIASILSALDDKIELNRRMNETLESMARAIFQSWFTELDLCEPPSVSDLIADGTLNMGDGYRAKRVELADAGLPFVRAGNLQDGGFVFENAELLCEESCLKAGEKNSQPFDVAFTSKGTVGRMTMVTPSTPPFVYSPQVCWWRVADRQRLDPHVLYRWMKSDEFMRQVAMVKGQTDMAEYVSLRDQRAMQVTLPPIENQKHIAPQLEAIDEKMANNRSESATLSAIRDTLLPKLLSGELPIPDALKQAEAVI